MIKTLLNPNHVLSDCDNIEDIDAQRMAAVLGKHLYGFKRGDNKAVVKVLGLDENDDVRWTTSGTPGGGLPPSSSADEGKALMVDENGEPEWAELPSGGDAAYSIDTASQASWNVDSLYSSTQFYLGNEGDNDGVEYYVDDQDRKAGYQLEEGHLYQVNWNCEVSNLGTSGKVFEGSVYITGPQDQNWFFQLDGSQAIGVSLTGSTIIKCGSSNRVLYFNARLNGSYTGSLPTMSMTKISIVDLTSLAGGAGGGGGSSPRYRAGEGISIVDDTISIDPTEAQEKLTAGPNIDIINNIVSTEKVVVAAGQNVSVTSSSDPSTRTITYTVNSSGGSGTQVQTDWDVSDPLSPAYLANKPQNLVQDADYVHSDNNFSNADKSKLANIEAGAQVNMKPDWTAAAGSASEILNKPNLSTVATSGAYSDLSGRPSIPTATSQLTNDSGFLTIQDLPAMPVQGVEVNGTNVVNSQGVAEVVVPAQVNADWTEASSASPAYIANKPVVKNLIAGAGITITETAQGIVIALA